MTLDLMAAFFVILFLGLVVLTIWDMLRTPR